MKFKVLKGTKLYDNLLALTEKCIRCNQAAFDMVKSLGFKGFRYKGGDTMAGGISSIKIPGGQPKGWRKAYPGRAEDEYSPSKIKQNKELLDKINSLPVVDNSELNELLQFDPFNSKGTFDEITYPARMICFHPSIKQKKGLFLIGVPEYMNYKPVKDMTEILESEYEKLSKSK